MRFATQAGGAPSGQEWFDRMKRLEALGYDTVAMPDHMIGGAWAAMNSSHTICSGALTLSSSAALADCGDRAAAGFSLKVYIFGEVVAS